MSSPDAPSQNAPSPNAVDRFFFAVEPAHAAILAVFALPDGTDSDYVSRLADEMRSVRNFQAPFNYRLQRPALRRVAPAFVAVSDIDIDLDYHFRYSTLPQPGGDAELDALVSDLQSQPLDMSKPLWEFHIIDGIAGGRFALYIKIHHGLMDGVGAMRRFEEMVGTQGEGTTVRPLWSIERPSRTTTPVAHASSAIDVTRSVMALGGAAVDSIRTAVWPTDEVVTAPFAAPRSVLNGRIAANRAFTARSYETDRIIGLARAFDVTVNDVFLALCAGGLRSYLSDRDELPDKSLTAGAPVSIRSGGHDQAANAITMMLVKLGTHIDDPVERLQFIAQSSSAAKLKLRLLPKGAADLYGALAMGPLALQVLTGTAGFTRPPFNLLISNVAGSPDRRYFGIAELRAAYGLTVLSDGQALNITAGSVGGTFNVAFLACPDSITDIRGLADATDAVLVELERAHASALTPPSGT